MTVERFPIEEGHILMFARAIGDPNPLYTDRDAAASSEAGGIIAPPTFVQASAQFDPDYILRPKDGRPWFGSGATASGIAGHGRGDSGGGGGGGGGGRGLSSGLHAEQRYEYHRPLRAGDVLSATTHPGRTWEKQGRRGGTLRFGESITEYRDQNGALVVTATSVGVTTERVPAEEGE
jgi:N-terminal half of MaoC dehydratase